MRICAHARAGLGHPAGEIAETFYNSVTRRVFQTVGTNPAIEYLDYHFERVPSPTHAQPLRTFAAAPDLVAAVEAMLASFDLGLGWAHRAADARAIAAAVMAEWHAGAAPYALDAVEMLEPVFYRRKGAYLVGRAIGRRPFFAHISPKKTAEGVVGGLVVATLSVALVLRLIGRSPLEALMLGPLLGIAAQAGDLAESMLKRSAGAKDSGTLIPGHGGFLLLAFTFGKIVSPFRDPKLPQNIERLVCCFPELHTLTRSLNVLHFTR